MTRLTHVTLVLWLAACSREAAIRQDLPHEGRDLLEHEVPAMPREAPTGQEVPQEDRDLLEHGRLVELLAIDDDPALTEALPGYHDLRVRAHVPLPREADRRRLARALTSAVAQGTLVALCFRPHHAIRVHHEGRTFDFVICLHCRQVALPPRSRDGRTLAIDPLVLEPVLASLMTPHGQVFDPSAEPFGRWRP